MIQILKVGSLKCDGNKRIILCLLAFLVFTVHHSLVTASDEIRSRAGIVIDASTERILYAKNPNLRLPPASTTKLMTAIVALDMANLSDVIEISKNAAGVSPTKAGFKPGDRVTVEALLYAALLRSANDAAIALAEAVAGSEERFVYLMNEKAASIGAIDTNFINPHGLPGDGQYTTVFDLSKIMRYALGYPKLKEIIGTRVREVSTEKGRAFFLKNTNELIWTDGDLIGGKTGYTRRARHCFVCAAERDNETLIIALLGSPSRKNLWQEAEELIQKGFQVIANNDEPVIYFVKADYESKYFKRTSYKNSLTYIGKNKKIRAEKSVKHKKKKILVKNKNKNLKNYGVAEKSGNRDKG